VHHILNSTNARGGLIRGMDGRAKIIFALGCVMVSAASPAPAAPLFVGALCLSITLIAGARIRLLAPRLAGPLFFALVIATVQAIATGGTPLAHVTISGIGLSLSARGVERGVMIIARVFGCASAVLFLSTTTPAERLLSGAARLGLPRGLVELLLFTYRYLFVLFDDAVTVYHAQKGRLGYAGLRVGIKSFGTLCGSVFLRAYDQAEATGAAMLQRGYTGEYVPCGRRGVNFRDAACLTALFIPCLAVFLWTL